MGKLYTKPVEELQGMSNFDAGIYCAFEQMEKAQLNDFEKLMTMTEIINIKSIMEANCDKTYCPDYATGKGFQIIMNLYHLQNTGQISKDDIRQFADHFNSFMPTSADEVISLCEIGIRDAIAKILTRSELLTTIQISSDGFMKLIDFIIGEQITPYELSKMVFIISRSIHQQIPEPPQADRFHYIRDAIEHIKERMDIPPRTGIIEVYITNEIQEKREVFPL